MEPTSCARGPVGVVAFALLLASVPSVLGESPMPQNDAGSGQDAPNDIAQGITIQPDLVYEGTSTGPLLDGADVYHLVGQAGQEFRGKAEGNLGCYYLHDAQGAAFPDNACSYEHAPLLNAGMVVTLPYTGDYYFRIAHLAPAVYKFAYSLTGDAPDVQTLRPLEDNGGDENPEPLPVPDGCNRDFVYVPGTAADIPKFTDPCYHMRTGLNHLDTPEIDVLIAPPVSPYPERDVRVTRQAVEMWFDGIQTLAPQMGLGWLSGMSFEIFIDDDSLATDPLWDPEIVVVTTNPVGSPVSIGIDPLDAVFNGSPPCHGQPNPLASMGDWEALPGFDSHHGGQSGTFSARCEAGGSICYAINSALDPAPGVINVPGVYDLVAHEFGHCLTVGHVGDANDFEAEAVPSADIMSYRDQPHRKCVSTLDVQSFALTMSRFFLDPPLGANHEDGPVLEGASSAASYQIQHPSAYYYASPTGLATDCEQPNVGLVPPNTPQPPDFQDDAGSGQDAPNAMSQAITIQPDIVYEGLSSGPVWDDADVYHFTGQAGQVFRGLSSGNLGCYYVHDQQGHEVDFVNNGCSYGPALNLMTAVVTLPYSGDYYFRITHSAPAVYKFAYSLTGDAPDVGTLILLEDL